MFCRLGDQASRTGSGGKPRDFFLPATRPNFFFPSRRICRATIIIALPFFRQLLYHSKANMEPPTKKPRKFLDDDSSSEDESGGVSLNNKSDNGFKINEEYARRFEHNKKREELQKCKLLSKTFNSFHLVLI